MAALEKAVAAADVGVTYPYLGMLIELTDVTRIGPTPPYTAETSEGIDRWFTEAEDAVSGVGQGRGSRNVREIGRRHSQASGDQRWRSASRPDLRGREPPADTAMKAFSIMVHIVALRKFAAVRADFGVASNRVAGRETAASIDSGGTAGAEGLGAGTTSRGGSGRRAHHRHRPDPAESMYRATLTAITTPFSNCPTGPCRNSTMPW